MRIYDEKNDKNLSRVLLCLERKEAKELRDSLDNLIGLSDAELAGTHHHVSGADYQKEINVLIYGEKISTATLDARISKLIKEDA